MADTGATLSPEEFQQAADSAFDARDYLKAYTLYGELLQATEDHYLAAFRRGLCAGYLSAAGQLRKEELLGGYAAAGQMLERLQKQRKIDRNYAASVRAKMSSTLTAFAMGRFHALDRVQDRPTFESREQAVQFTRSVQDCVELLQAVSTATEQEAEQKQLLSACINACDIGMKEDKLRYQSGITDENGTMVQEYAMYKVPRELIGWLKSRRHGAVTAYNDLPSLRSEAERLHTAIETEKSVISDYQTERKKFLQQNTALRRSHRSFCRWTALATGLAVILLGVAAVLWQPWLWVGAAAALLAGAATVRIHTRRFERANFPAPLLAKRVKFHRSRRALRKKKGEQSRFRTQTMKK